MYKKRKMDASTSGLQEEEELKSILLMNITNASLVQENRIEN